MWSAHPSLGDLTVCRPKDSLSHKKNVRFYSYPKRGTSVRFYFYPRRGTGWRWQPQTIGGPSSPPLLLTFIWNEELGHIFICPTRRATHRSEIRKRGGGQHQVIALSIVFLLEHYPYVLTPRRARECLSCCAGQPVQPSCEWCRCAACKQRSFWTIWPRPFPFMLGADVQGSALCQQTSFMLGANVQGSTLLSTTSRPLPCVA